MENSKNLVKQVNSITANLPQLKEELITAVKESKDLNETRKSHALRIVKALNTRLSLVRVGTYDLITTSPTTLHFTYEECSIPVGDTAKYMDYISDLCSDISKSSSKIGLSFANYEPHIDPTEVVINLTF